MIDRSSVRRAHLVVFQLPRPCLNRIYFTQHLSVCLVSVYLPLSLSESLSLPDSESGDGAAALVSCRERNLKGSGINKRRASQTKLQ